MVFWQFFLMVAITAVVIEFGVHVVYHALTGKAGIEEDAFSYLGDICDDVRQYRSENKKVIVTVVERGA